MAETQIDDSIANRERLGKFLYFFAWAVEIVAVIIGLAIGLAMVTDGYAQQTEALGLETLSFSGVLNIIVSALPFLMVAMVELTKIPFAEAYYRARTLGWKLLFLIALLFLSIITMESALNGFERTFASMVTSISLTKNKTVELEERIADLAIERESLANLNSEAIEGEYNKRQAQLSEEKNDQIESIRLSIDTIRGTYDTARIDGLREQRASLQKELDDASTRHQNQLDRLETRFQTDADTAADDIGRKQRNMRENISRLQGELDRIQDEKREVVDGSLFFRKDALKKEFDSLIAEQREKIAAVEEQLNKLSVQDAQTGAQREKADQISQTNRDYLNNRKSIALEIDDIDKTIGQANSVRDAELEEAVATYRKEASEVNRVFQEQSLDNVENRDRLLSLLRGNEAQISEKDEELTALRSQRTSLRNAINQTTADTQVYRLAQWAYGMDSAADLNKQQVMVVAYIWFGSLAALVAFTGVFLALASFVVRDQGPLVKKIGPFRTLINNIVSGVSVLFSALTNVVNSFRRLLIYSRKKFRQPLIKEVEKEVVREVVVEKIVTTEVPVEVIKRELVYVPMYTSDKTLLSIQNDESPSTAKQKEGAVDADS